MVKPVTMVATAGLSNDWLRARGSHDVQSPHLGGSSTGRIPDCNRLSLVPAQITSNRQLTEESIPACYAATANLFCADQSFSKPATYGLRFIPTTRTEDLEPCIDEPLLRRHSTQTDQRPFACGTPRIRSGHVCIVAPEESHALTAVNCESDVFADQPNALTAVPVTCDCALRFNVPHN